MSKRIGKIFPHSPANAFLTAETARAAAAGARAEAENPAGFWAEAEAARAKAAAGAPAGSRAAEKYFCALCGKEYKTAKSLAGHRKKEHPLDILPEDPPAEEKT